jgi:hypothetical protein
MSSPVILLLITSMQGLLFTTGSFTCMKEEAKWDLLDCIQENTEGWENDKGR